MEMFQILLIVFTTFFSNTATGSDYEDVFHENADGIFESLLGDTSKINHTIPLPLRKEQLKEDEIQKSNITTEKTVIATEHTYTKRGYNITMDDIAIRKRNIQIVRLLNKNEHPIPDFANDADDPGIITRRFDAIRTKLTAYKPEQYLREQYFYWENQTRINIEKGKTIALMGHYIYETRYRLPYSQLLRIKYKDHVRYKIGYLFALMRQLKQQQMTIYSTLVNNYLKTLTLHLHIKLYEKVVRLNMDLRDVILYIKQLERQRKLMEDPTYYDSDKK